MIEVVCEHNTYCCSDSYMHVDLSTIQDFSSIQICELYPFEGEYQLTLGKGDTIIWLGLNKSSLDMLKHAIAEAKA